MINSAVTWFYTVWTLIVFNTSRPFEVPLFLPHLAQEVFLFFFFFYRLIDLPGFSGATHTKSHSNSLRSTQPSTDTLSKLLHPSPQSQTLGHCNYFVPYRILNIQKETSDLSCPEKQRALMRSPSSLHYLCFKAIPLLLSTNFSWIRTCLFPYYSSSFITAIALAAVQLSARRWEIELRHRGSGEWTKETIT